MLLKEREHQKSLIFRRTNGPKCLVDLSGIPPLNNPTAE
jgi:hypothetical protein